MVLYARDIISYINLSIILSNAKLVYRTRCKGSDSNYHIKRIVYNLNNQSMGLSIESIVKSNEKTIDVTIVRDHSLLQII